VARPPADRYIPGLFHRGAVTSTLRDQLQTALGQAYVLDRELGGGGMSHVFLAHEQALGRQVVVKVLLPELAAGVNIDRFRREIQLAAQLQHPHIVPLLSAGEANGLPYFIMPYVTGESLRSRVAREGELPIAEAIRIVRDVVSALAYAHGRGVVHRDVKPDNVLLSGGVAVVTDFGVAKAVSASAEEGQRSGITSLGVALGTPTYMSPEQATASPQTDHRADIYALGVMAYEMLTGMPPFTGRSPQAVLAAHVVEEAPPVDRRRPAVPPTLASLVHQCLAKRPADRPQSAAEVMHVLDVLATPSGGMAPTTEIQPLTQIPVAATPVPAEPGARRRSPLSPAIAVLASVILAGVLARWGGLWPAGAGRADSGTVATLDSAAMSPRTTPVASPVPADTAADSARRATPPAPPPPVARTGPRPKPTPRPVPRVVEKAPPAPATPGPATVESTLTEPTPPVTADSQPPIRPIPPPAAAPAQPPAVVGRAPVAGETAKAAVPPRPPAPPSDPRPDIRAVLADYVAAVESESLAELRRVYPAMTMPQQRGWEQFFQLVRNVKAELAIGRLDVSDASAEAQVNGSYTYLNTSTQRIEHQPVAFRASLAREAGRWRILQIR
jgi:serine/threonine-protein kinase